MHYALTLIVFVSLISLETFGVVPCRYLGSHIDVPGLGFEVHSYIPPNYGKWRTTTIVPGVGTTQFEYNRSGGKYGTVPGEHLADNPAWFEVVPGEHLRGGKLKVRDHDRRALQAMVDQGVVEPEYADYALDVGVQYPSQTRTRVVAYSGNSLRVTQKNGYARGYIRNGGREVVGTASLISGQVSHKTNGRLSYSFLNLPWMKDYPDIGATVNRNSNPLIFEGTRGKGSGGFGAASALVLAKAVMETMVQGESLESALLFVHSTTAENHRMYKGHFKLVEWHHQPKGEDLILFNNLRVLSQEIDFSSHIPFLPEIMKGAKVDQGEGLRLLKEITDANQRHLDFFNGPSTINGLALFDRSTMGRTHLKNLLQEHNLLHLYSHFSQGRLPFFENYLQGSRGEQVWAKLKYNNPWLAGDELVEFVDVRRAGHFASQVDIHQLMAGLYNEYVRSLKAAGVSDVHAALSQMTFFSLLPVEDGLRPKSVEDIREIVAPYVQNGFRIAQSRGMEMNTRPRGFNNVLWDAFYLPPEFVLVYLPGATLVSKAQEFSGESSQGIVEESVKHQLDMLRLF